MREANKQQAIELQVFITKLYFNDKLWNNEFVQIFFEPNIKVENEYSNEIKKQFENDSNVLNSNWDRQISLSNGAAKDIKETFLK